MAKDSLGTSVPGSHRRLPCVREGTPLQIKLNKFAYVLLFLAVICAIIVFGVAEFDINNEVILYAIALGIGVIPESARRCAHYHFQCRCQAYGRKQRRRSPSRCS